jgi:hypothetical protein
MGKLSRSKAMASWNAFMPESFNAFIARALDGIERDAPACATAMAKALGDARIVARIDEETTVCRRDGTRPKVDDRDPGAVPPDERTVLLETTARTLVELLSGRDTLLCAVKSNALCIRAPSSTAACLFDAMSIFIEGVARSSDATSLYECFLRAFNERRP